MNFRLRPGSFDFVGVINQVFDGELVFVGEEGSGLEGGQRVRCSLGHL